MAYVAGVSDLPALISFSSMVPVEGVSDGDASPAAGPGSAVEWVVQAASGATVTASAMAARAAGSCLVMGAPQRVGSADDPCVEPGGVGRALERCRLGNGGIDAT